jgi:SMC interacting uncharacterized protein involved in chromosome segregation
LRRTSIAFLLAACCFVLALPATLASASSKKKTDPIADLRAAIAKEVADPDRAAKMSATVDEMERLIGEAGRFAGKLNAELTPMLKDYGVSRETIEAKFEELNAERAVLAERMFEAHLAFKAAATPEEWKKLKKAGERALAEALAKSVEQPALVGKEG